MDTKSIVIADASPEFRIGLKSFLVKKGYRVTGDCADGYEAMRLIEEVRPDAVILDIAVAKNYVATGDFKMLDGALLDESCHIIAKEGNTELMDAINKALDAFLESDAYPELLKTYGIES